jgi:ubiquinone/menaquinone biosynthesis C-methylase UbiE
MTDHTRKTYDQIAEQYQLKRNNFSESGWNEYLEVPAMEEMLKPIASGKKVLDLGSGTGILTAKLQTWGARSQGLELSSRMVEIARKTHPQIEFTVGNAEQLPFEDLSFDIVASSLVMHYMQNLIIPFKEIRRVLKPHGTFIFSIHHPFNECLQKDSDHVKALNYFHNDKYLWEMCGAKLESYHHTFENIINALNAAGFVVEKIKECRPSPEIKNQFSDFDFTYNFPSFCLFKAAF